jgi:pimeloyl-ACP methyl ester carboxylesterase
MRHDGEHFVNIDGIAVRYRDEGTGPPVLLIHGLGVPMETWTYTIPALAAARRVLAFDVPGHGRSSMPRDGAYYTWDGVGRFVRHFLEWLDVTGPLAVIGHSMGGLIAAQFPSHGWAW